MYNVYTVQNKGCNYQVDGCGKASSTEKQTWTLQCNERNSILTEYIPRLQCLPANMSDNVRQLVSGTLNIPMITPPRVLINPAADSISNTQRNFKHDVAQSLHVHESQHTLLPLSISPDSIICSTDCDLYARVRPEVVGWPAEQGGGTPGKQSITSIVVTFAAAQSSRKL